MVNMLSLLPITIGRYNIRVLRYKDINWYIKTIKRRFFNEYIDNKVEGKSDIVLKSRLANLITGWKLNRTNNKSEIRCVIEEGQKLVGGITIFHANGVGEYKIGYWVVPESQRKGIAFNALLAITYRIKNNTYNFKSIQLIIREDNIKSIKLAEKAGYIHVGEYEGENRVNLIYEIE